MVLCCICGVEIRGVSQGARCLQCLQKEVDITAGIGRRVRLQQCGTCGKWLRSGGSGNQWAVAELESRELLAICLKHVKGISKELQLVNAGFIWTEPHSKELKVKLVLQQEILAGVVVQQTVAVELRVDNLQCPPCKKLFTRHTWESSVQVRQRTGHRRTLLNLEQLILKHKAHTQLIKVEATKEGVDFFFTKERDAQAFVAFVKSWAVVRHHDSKHLVSHNCHNSSYRFKRTTCVELCPVCRDDLVVLPQKTAQALGGLPPLVLCTRAASVVGLVDPASGRSIEVSAVEYWKRPFLAACSGAQLTEFVVLDVTPLDPGGGSVAGRVRCEDAAGTGPRCRGQISLCEVEIARVSDFGHNEERVLVRSHLGHLLRPSDVALGYDLRTLNVGLDDEEMAGVPLDVYLVRKQRPEKAARPRTSRRAKSGAGTAPVSGAASEAGDAQGAAAAGEDPDEEEDEGLRVAAERMLDAFSLAETVPEAVGASEEGDEAGGDGEPGGAREAAGGPCEGAVEVEAEADADAEAVAGAEAAPGASGKGSGRRPAGAPAGDGGSETESGSDGGGGAELLGPMAGKGRRTRSGARGRAGRGGPRR